MKTYLLTWNPEKYDWIEIEEDAQRINSADNTQIDRWSCGNTRKIAKGDRIFLMRLGQGPKGIVAAGWVVNGSFEAPHWDEAKAAAGGTTRFVNIIFSNLLIPGKHKIIRLEYLKADEFQGMHWTPQSSGISIPDEIVRNLEKLWSNVVRSQLGHVNDGKLNISSLTFE